MNRIGVYSLETGGFIQNCTIVSDETPAGG
jgi:hypothetical protein